MGTVIICLLKSYWLGQKGLGGELDYWPYVIKRETVLAFKCILKYFAHIISWLKSKVVFILVYGVQGKFCAFIVTKSKRYDL